MKNEINQLINYAVKEGYLDEDTAREMTPEEKEKYYWECQLKEPDEEEGGE